MLEFHVVVAMASDLQECDMKSYKTIRIDGKKRKYHVVMWEMFFGIEVPEGCVIHHLDGNKFNNDISNLSCISRSMHNCIHNAMRWGNKMPTHKQTREERASKNREYVKSNIEHIRIKKRISHSRWVSENRERARELDREYRKRNHDKIIQRDRERYLRRREQVLAQKRMKYHAQKTMKYHELTERGTDGFGSTGR